MDKKILNLKLEFPERFTDSGDNFLHEEHIPAWLKPEDEVERVIEDLFKRNPKAKIAKIGFSPSFAEDDRGGTITIHGKI